MGYTTNKTKRKSGADFHIKLRGENIAKYLSPFRKKMTAYAKPRTFIL